MMSSWFPVQTMIGMKLTAGLILLMVYAAHCEPCDLTGAQECLGDAVDLVPRFYLNPADTALRNVVRQHYCGRGIENCMTTVKGNCSDVMLAPYHTIVSAVNFVCHTDMDEDSTCVTSAPLQREVGLCFRLFKVIIDSVMEDPDIDTGDVNEGLCSAYDDVFTCSLNAAESKCDVRGQSYLQTLLFTTSSANRHVLGCL